MVKKFQNIITTKRNLLAFSGGVDSSALFFLLLQHHIPFDICIVNYHQREEAMLEIAYGEELANIYNKKCFVVEYPYDKFNEKLARDFRYDTFSKIINRYQYDSLITAHQLNDKFEWFLMQLSKGAGLNELIGLSEVENRDNYTLYRPLLQVSKEELLEYLHQNKHKYFVDSSNFDTKYRRNFFRKEFSDKYIKLYKDGLLKSFEYLQNDIETLTLPYKRFEFEDLLLFTFETHNVNHMVRTIDKELKKRGFLLSSKTRKEITSQKSLVISHKVSLEIVENRVWIAPFINLKMDKKMKEKYRIAKIPKLIRPYLSQFPHFDTSLF